MIVELLSETKTLKQSAKFLVSHLGGSTTKWHRFLSKNSRNKSGYKITARIADGKLAYTEEALLEFVRVTLTPHEKEVTKVKLESLSDENINEIAVNLVDENEGNFDFKTAKGIDEASRTAVYYYKLAGFELKYADIKRELTRQINVLKKLELM